MYEVHIYSDDTALLSKLRETLPRSVFLNQWESAIIFSCWADSISEVYAVEKMLRSEPGVKDVVVKFHAKAILSSSRLVAWVDEEMLRLKNKVI